MSKAILRKLLPPCVAASLFAAGCSLIRPLGAIDTAQHNEPILRGAEIDPATRALIERSCQNCHSLKTTLPFYSYVPPISWLIMRDVQHARSHMNLSHWQEYSSSDRLRLLSEIGSVVRNRKMPVQRYLLLHPEARLSDEERQQIYEWTRTERSRLKSHQRHREAIASRTK
jgi:Haem-binding domain